jgi:sulfhydrogenase subunit beta (sulfur reductase)
MKTLTLTANDLSLLLEALKQWGTLWAPVEHGENDFRLEVVDDVTRARPEVLRTTVPFKKLLLKPSFVMLEGAPGEIPNNPGDNDRGRQVLFGAHACDIHALKILDLLYLGDYTDPYNLANRSRLVVVGFGCWPDARCFCASMDTSTADDGFDLYLTPLEDRLLVSVGSSKGDDIVRASPHLFAPATDRDTADYLERSRQRSRAFTLEVDISDLPYILELKRDDPVWDEIGARCLCCGSCSTVCPTCSCFNVADEIGADGLARRRRTWDACLFRDYATVAGGHNFRDDRADRVRARYYHKQEAFVREFGMPSCVGCGRCIENCPTGINVVDVFTRVRGHP